MHVHQLCGCIRNTPSIAQVFVVLCVGSGFYFSQVLSAVGLVASFLHIQEQLDDSVTHSICWSGWFVIPCFGAGMTSPTNCGGRPTIASTKDRHVSRGVLLVDKDHHLVLWWPDDSSARAVASAL